MIQTDLNNFNYNIEAAILYNILSYQTYRKEIFGLCQELDFTVGQHRQLFVELHKAYANDIIDTVDFKRPFMSDWHEILKSANGKRWPLVKIDFFSRSMRRHGKNKVDMLSMWFNDPTVPINEIQKVVKELHEIVHDARVYKQPLRKLKNVLEATLADLQKKLDGNYEYIKWGLKLLDDLCPCEEQDLNILAARPGIGKTVAVHNCILESSKYHPVGYWCGEMSEPVIGMRLLSILTGILHETIRDPKELTPGQLKTLCDEIERAKDKNIYISTAPGMTVEGISVWAKQLVEYEGVKHIFVDYIQRLEPTNSRAPRRDQVQHMSNGLKNLACELNITVTALAQLNRESAGEEPKVSHLAECGFLEQDASTVILLDRIKHGENMKKRNYVYREPGTDNFKDCTAEQLENTMIMNIAKSRHAAEWTLYADCDLSTFTIGSRKQFEGSFNKRFNHRK